MSEKYKNIAGVYTDLVRVNSALSGIVCDGKEVVRAVLAVSKIIYVVER